MGTAEEAVLILDEYRMAGGKKLRLGYTTGSCAAAAAKAAAYMLLSGEGIKEVRLMTPKGIELQLPLVDIDRRPEAVSCAVIKDSGDDPDVTDRVRVYATVERLPQTVSGADRSPVMIDGGEGIGRVTQAGLDQPVGAAAINRIPRQMIKEEVQEMRERFGEEYDLKVIISVPQGRELAARTFNPRLGINGGISILGTSGIIEPMSEKALVDTIRTEIRQQALLGNRRLLMTPGNYGQQFLRERGIDLERAIKFSNYVGEAVDLALAYEIKEIEIAAHIGKFIKVAGGIMNTHSAWADSRAEIMTALALRAGASTEQLQCIADSLTTEEALDYVFADRLVGECTIKLVLERVLFYLEKRSRGSIRFCVTIFSNRRGELGQIRSEGYGE
ncbi:MAG: cobalt-precorrin-5B (C(1))-methyltransferase CbiD [Lachnospiraceae bacterium]|nr:cobalt-precorrin-5B (C(1))-methyltransferase CbiD [Lachnospiraceae bacterium]MDY5741703.1 cobalt-precorrin-5B (C(1))-methyltransferase CbiD [Lachnospiraceae bacterium]